MLFSLKDDKVIKIKQKFINISNHPSIVLEVTFGTGGIFTYEIKNERQLNCLVEWFIMHVHEFISQTKDEFKKTLTYDLDNIK